MWTYTFDYFNLFLLVFARMSGMVLLNPLFSRRNVPTTVRMGLVLGLTIILTPTLPIPPDYNAVEFVFTLLQEVSVGFVCGFIFQLFYYMLFFAGDFLDMQFGLAMAKAFDPGTDIQASLSGNLLTILFMLYIFATDSHLVLIQTFANSYQVLGIGVFSLTGTLPQFILELFIAIFSLTMRLLMPFLVVELTLEISMGILMKLIPQIHVFVINIQFKLLMGIILLFAFAPAIGAFLDKYIILMFENIQKAMFAAAG